MNEWWNRANVIRGVVHRQQLKGWLVDRFVEDDKGKERGGHEKKSAGGEEKPLDPRRHIIGGDVWRNEGAN